MIQGQNFKTLGNADFQWMSYGTGIFVVIFGDRRALVAGSGSNLLILELDDVVLKDCSWWVRWFHDLNSSSTERLVKALPERYTASFAGD